MKKLIPSVETGQVQPGSSLFPAFRSARWVRSRSVAEIAEAEDMDVTHIRRLMRLTLLAPPLLEHVTKSSDIVLERVMRRTWPNGWGDQMQVLASAKQSRSRNFSQF